MISNTEIQARLEKFQAAARAAGVKLTHQRLEIFREVAASLEHPDAEAVFRTVKTRLPTVSLDTVYRTLWLLHDLGLVATLGPRRGSVRFDANLEPHHHYVCVRCGLTRDFTSDRFDALDIPDSVSSFGSIVVAHVEVRGVCRDCAANSAAAEPADPSPPEQEARRET
ncbi:MAG: transcriptional repressor [Gemmatimonas sp.]|nr:transcriptional repressor [Gemmatimonas sp.]